MILWAFDPVLRTVGPLTIRWYGVLFVGAFLVGQWMLARMFEREGVPGRPAERLMLCALIGTILGGA